MTEDTTDLLNLQVSLSNGTLRVSSHDVPGLFLSSKDHAALWRDLIPAIDGLCAANGVRNKLHSGGEWQPIETAKKDGTVVWVYTAAYLDLPAFQGTCAYHKDAGWCTDELREVTHWMPLPEPPGYRHD